VEVTVCKGSGDFLIAYSFDGPVILRSLFSATELADAPYSPTSAVVCNKDPVPPLTREKIVNPLTGFRSDDALDDAG
jgi:hypothetical protein